MVSQESESSATAIALIPAAGVGQRFGGQTRKAFVKLEGRPLLWHVLDRLSAAHRVSACVVALHLEDLPLWESLPGLSSARQAWKPLHLVAGGTTRAHSVAAALAKALTLASSATLACIHDAARPWVDPEQVDQVIAAAAACGAAALARPVTDTVKLQEETGLLRTLPREQLWAMQTPQVISLEILSQALTDWRARGEPLITDDLQWLEGMKLPVRLVEGSSDNKKITFFGDLS